MSLAALRRGPAAAARGPGEWRTTTGALCTGGSRQRLTAGRIKHLRCAGKTGGSAGSSFSLMSYGINPMGFVSRAARLCLGLSYKIRPRRAYREPTFRAIISLRDKTILICSTNLC